jgi:hypothetical protein
MVGKSFLGSLAILIAVLGASTDARADACGCDQITSNSGFLHVANGTWNTPALEGTATGTSGTGSIAVQARANDSSGTAIDAHAANGTAGWFDGNVYYTGTLSHSSDARLKKDVRELSYGLEAALRLRPVAFRWKQGPDAKQHLGLIAQEVQSVIPEVVRDAPDPTGPSFLAIDYPELVPVLLRSIQEQNKLILTQEARIRALEGRSPPRLSSMLGGGGGIAFGLIPLGLFVAGQRLRRMIRKDKQLP